MDTRGALRIDRSRIAQGAGPSITERQRLQRARMLLADRLKQCSPALAWRNANPGSKASDKSAAEMCRRELVWLSRWLDEHLEGRIPAAGDWRKKPERCIGIPDRPCGEEIPRRQKRCEACAAAQRQLDRRGYKRKHHRSHRELENAKRNERRCRQHQRERDVAATVAELKEIVHRAALPRLKRDRVTGRPYLYYPKTGKREYLDSERRFGG